MNTTQGHQKHARKPERRPARTSSGNLGLLGKVLATLLAVNMAIMFALPIGIFADDITANNGVTDVVYEDQAAPAEVTPAPTEPANTGGGSAAPGAGATELVFGDDLPAYSPTEGSGEIGLYNYPFNPTGTTVNVSTWQQFWDAWNTSTVSTIVLTTNITRTTTGTNTSSGNRLPALNRDLKITSQAGSTYNLSLGTEANALNAFTLANRTSAASVYTLGFYNVNIGRNNSGTTTGYYLVSTGVASPTVANTLGWRVVFSNVANGGTSATSGLVNLPGAEVIFDETVTWNIAQTGTTVLASGRVSLSKRVEITEDARVTLSTTHNTVLDITGGGVSYFWARPGAVVELVNNWTGDGSSQTEYHGQAIWYHGIDGVAGNHFTVDKATIRGTAYGSAATGDQSGVFNFNGTTGNATNRFKLNIINGGKVYGTSNGRMATFVTEVPYAQFNVGGSGSRLELTSWKGMVEYAGTLRFRESGYQEFNIYDNAEVYITKQLWTGTTAANGIGEVPAVRFGHGGNNSFNAWGGGKLFIESYGNGTPMDQPDANYRNLDANNAAINVGSGGFTFNVSDEGSIISIKSYNGAAFSANSTNATSSSGPSTAGNVKININKGSNFLAWGTTQTQGAGIIVASNNDTGANRTVITMNEPRYYDFRNLRSGGGRIFAVGSNAYFDSLESNLEVWSHGSNLEGDPYATWWKFTYGLTGTNFGTIRVAPPKYPDFGTVYRNATYYSRMSANNAKAYLDPIADLTNADKFVRAFAHVPEGINSIGRPAWTDEIWGHFLHNGTAQLAYSSIQAEPVYTVQTGAATLNGVLRYTNTNTTPTTDDDFLIPGDTYSLVKDAWRGPAGDPGSGYTVDSDKIPDTVATVADVTPPDRVTVSGASHEFSTTTYTGKIFTGETVLEGTYPNMATSPSAAWNGQLITDIYAVVNGTGTQYHANLPLSGGTWKIENLPTLNAGDIVYIVAKDATGIENPLVETKFHDATFPAASKLTVSEFPIDVNIGAADIWIGLLRANTIQNGPPTTTDPGATLEARMLALLKASASVKAGYESTPISTDLIISSYGVAPNVFTADTFTKDAFGTANKEYTITIALKDYPSYTTTAKVTVYPYEDLVQADDEIILWVNQAAALLGRTPPLSAIHSDLISLGHAVGASGANSSTGQPLAPWLPANVDVLDYNFAAIATSPSNPGSENYYVTFALKTDHTVTKITKITVRLNNTPVLDVPSPVVIWIGEPGASDRTPGSLTPTEFNSLPGDKWMNGVTAYDYEGVGAPDITSSVTYSGEGAVNLAKLSDPGEYIVTYTVTNSDSVTTNAYRTYVVTNVGNIFGNFRLDAHSFVVKPADANVGNILTKSEASGWEFDASLPEGGRTRPVVVTGNTGYGVGAAINTNFNITLNIPASNSQANPPGPATRTIVARIVNKEVLTENGKDNVTGKKYSIGANNYFMTVPEAATLVGTSDAVKTSLIDKAKAEGWLLDSTLTAKDVTVTYNGITAGAKYLDEFDVTFAINESQGIAVTVKFKVTADIPVINFNPESSPGALDGGSPLVIQRTPTTHPMTLAELKQKVTPVDSVDTTAWLLERMQVHVPGGTALPNIDTMNVGVYRVAYDVTNSAGLAAATAYRAIIITDGRYTIDREGGGVGATGLIIGAQDFVQKRADVNGNMDQARDWSYAEAFDIEGNALAVTATNPTGANTSAAYGMQPPFDDYPFTWRVAGHAATKVTIGHVVDADSVWPGTKNNPYAVTAKDFWVNTTVAASIIGADSYIAAADARAYKLVSARSDTFAAVIGTRGVPTLFAATLGDYPGISFGIQVNGVELGASSRASITGHVSNGNPPDLQVSRPYGITVGATFNPMHLVSAADFENGSLTGAVKYNLTSALSGTNSSLWTDIRPANPINTANIGLYPLTYWVSDSDYNVDIQNRVAVVNDGRYVLGQASQKGASGISVSTGIDGKILYGRSFVVKSGDVSGDLTAQIISNSAPSTFNGSTGQAAASAGVTVYNSGSYSATPNNYTITLQADDVPSGVIQKNIVGKVVDATTLANNNVASTTFTDWTSPISGQVVTPTQNGEGAVTYVYGTSIPEMLPSAATAILTAPDPNAALITALKASAVIATPGYANDTMINTNVKVVSVRSDTGATAFSAAQGTYRVLIADTADKSSIWLTISVSIGSIPWVQATPKPLEITAATTPGFITDAQIRYGVTAGDTENGNLTSRVTYKIYNQDGTLAYTFATGDSVTSIPREVAGFYRVVYTVKDDDGNDSAPESRALLINDGRYTFDDAFVIEGRSFVVGISEVTSYTGTPQDQIISLSGARAWNVAGEPAPLEVKTIGSYGGAVTDAKPELGIVGYAPAVPFGKTVTARIYVKGENLEQGQGANGERYSLRADNFRINITDANALKAQTGTAYNNAFISRAVATSFDRSSTNLVQLGSVGLVNDGGFRTATFLTPSDPGYPTKVPITFRVNEETGATVTIYAVVSNGTYPTISVTSPKEVAFGSTFGETEYMQGVTAQDSENGDITSRITHNNPVNTNIWGPVVVTYNVTDLENNPASATGIVVVGEVNGSYWVQPGYDFVTIPSQAPTTDGGILTAAWAKAQRVDAIWPDSPDVLPVDVSPIVYDKTGYATTEGDYPIKIGVTAVAPYTVDPALFPTITAKVINRGVLATDNNTAKNATHYAVAADASYSIAPSEVSQYAGTTPSLAVRAKLIESARAIAYKMDLGPVTVEHGVDVKSSAIPASPAMNVDYPVVFTPAGQPSVEITVMFKVANSGPVITFTQDPLVVEYTAASHIMTAAELKDRSLAADAAGVSLTASPDYTATPASGGSIDTHNVGVYLVNYRVVDSYGLIANAQRYVVVNDGRYLIVDEDSDGKNDVIIGARNFLTKSIAVTGGVDEVRTWSYAEAFDNVAHTALTPLTTLPLGWTAAPSEGTYSFTWYPTGHPTATKTIQGIVTDADVIDTGDKNSQYGMVGYNFSFIGDDALTQAQTLINSGDTGFVSEARAEVILLVGGTSVTPPAARVISRGGFTAAYGIYDIRFGAFGQPDAQPTVTIKGTVYPTALPTLDVPTPIEVWIGSPTAPTRPAGSILPGDYTGDLYGVTAHSDKDGDLIGSVVVTGDTVDLTTVGLYHRHYSVTDTDSRTVTADRLVVVNDGRIVVGDGRVLLANGFVTTSGAVTTNSAAIPQELKDKSGATLRDGKTGAELSGALITVANHGGYSATPNETPGYQVTFTAPDIPSGTLTRTIIAKVVDEEEIGGPEPPDPFVDSTYTYGTSIVVTTSEMEAIIAGGDAETLRALSVYASKTKADGTFDDVNVKVVSYDKPLATTTGTYTVTVSDVNDQCAIPLTISTWTGHPPVITAPKPIVVQWTNSTTNLTWAELMDGTYAPKSGAAWHVTATDDENGNLTSVVTITDPATGLFPAIPHNAVGTYQVRYRVEDSDHNFDVKNRAVVIDDGNTIYDDDYVLQAASFVIGELEVDTSTPAAQILSWSGAVATTTEGDPAVATVSELGAYGNPLGGLGDKKPLINVSGHPAVFKEITARVYNKGDEVSQGQGANGTLYSLLAKNFRINITDANALKAQTGTAYDNAFITRSAAESYLRNDPSLVQGGTVSVVDTSNFKTATFLSPGDPGYPTRVPITFCVNQETSTTVTIYAVVHNGSYPTVTVTTPKQVDKGAVFGETEYMQGVTAYDNEDLDITSAVTHTPVGLAVNTAVPGVYTVKYDVTDSEGNAAASAYGIVVVGYIVNGDYVVQNGYDFVTIPTQTPDNDADILAAADARAWRITLAPGETDKVPVSPIVYNKTGYSSSVADHPVTIGVTATAPYTVDPTKFPTITAKVVDRTGIAKDTNNVEGATHYAVAANVKVLLTLSELSGRVGLSNVAKANLIDSAMAEAYKMDLGPVTVSHEVDVKSNGIPASPVYGTEYPVVFTPKDAPSVELTVMFKLAAIPPTILFTEDPLVVVQTPDSHVMTADELKAQSVVTNYAGTNIKSLMTATPASGGSIDQHNIGVYLVNYQVVDPVSGLDTTAQRYIVVNDGRYEFIDEDGDSDIDVIVGARDFLTASSDVTGGEDEVRAWSFAEAVDNNTHTAIQVHTALPVGWGAAPVEGEYDFTWIPDGHPTVSKTIQGIVSDADVIDPGTKNSQYGMTAYNFSYIGDDALTRATALLAAGNPGFIAQARVEVISLVSGITPPAARVIDRGGFVAAYGIYDIRFGAAGQPDAQPTVTIKGTVYPTALPTLDVPTPIDVWTGDPSDPARPAESILPSDYTGDLYGVTAYSDKDGDLIGSVVVTGDTVDLTAVGLYHRHYSVTDSDSRTVTADRLVVVNDGRLVVGESRVLLANGFVIKSTAVAAPSGINQQLKDKSDATLFDGKTGAELSGALVTVANSGGYSSTPNETPGYQVTFTAPDVPSGTLTKTITAKVVDEEEIGGPEPPDPFVDSTYTYGTSIVVTTSEMEAIIAGGDAETLRALSVYASKTKADGTFDDVAVKVVSYDKPLATAPGTYTVTVSDVDDKCAIPLTISTWIGHPPVITAPKPIVVQWTNSTTNLTWAELMNGTYAPKSSTAWHVTAADDEDKDLTSAVTITDPATGLFPAIPHNAVGTYQVRYRVEDSDHNFDVQNRAVVIDDGNTIYDDEYVLQAASFVIGDDQVDTTTPRAQILSWSNAVATTTEGDPAIASVAELGAYSGTVGLKKPLINVSGHPAVFKEITALVYARGDAIGQGQGANGSLYSLLAKNFRINITDANALKAQTGNAYDNAFITRSAAESYLRNDPSLVQGGTVRVVDTGGFKTTTFAQPGNASYPTAVPITFCVNEETGTLVTINAYVSNGNDPTIDAPMKYVAVGSTFGDAQYREGVTAADSENGDLTSAITYVATKPVNTAVKGMYWADYTVTDSDYNTVTTRGFIGVGITDLGNYAIDPYFDFVMASAEVTGTNAEIIAKSHAKAWRVDNIDPDHDTLPLEVPSALIVPDNGGYGSVVGEYTIMLGIDPTAPYTTIPANFPTITAKVIDQDLINTLPGETDPDDGTKVTPDDGNDENKDNPADADRYDVAATRVVHLNSSDVAPLVGLSASAKVNLRDAAEAVAFKINGSTGIVSHDIDVIANEITSGAKVGDSFYVTFIPKGVPSVWIKVKFVVSDGNPPTITTGGPLEVDKTAGSQLMTVAELMAGVTATDPEDGPLTSSVVVTDPKTGMLPQINKNTVGIYQVHYAVTDSDGNPGTADRAIIVTDGRYDLIPDNPSKPGEITYIIGAKSFVVRQADCATTAPGQLALAREKSYIEVFDAAGNEVSAQVVLQGSASAGFLGRQPGPYPFTWALAGHPLVTKSNTGTIVSNDYVVDPGDKNSSYALIAKPFTVDVNDARNITAEPAYVLRADAALIKLVDKAPNKSVRLINNGGFVATEKTYSITFGDDTSDRNTLSVTIDATVMNNARTFTVTFNGNGGTLVGPSRISVTEPNTTLPYMPASPIRTGYTFRYWSTSSANTGAQFAYDTRLTGDVTLYALWDAIPVVPPTTPTPPPPVNVVVNTPPSGGGGGTTINVGTPANTIVEIPVPQAAEPEPTPEPEEIDDGQTPLGSPKTWSLFDLLATILAALMLVVFFVKFFFDRPKDEVYEEEPIDAQLWAAMTPEQRAQYQARRESDYQVWLSDQQRAANRPKALFVNAPVLLIVAAALVEALIVLFTTQVFSAPTQMIIVDNLSVIFALILFVQLLSPMVAAVIRNNRRANQLTPSQPPAEASAPTA